MDKYQEPSLAAVQLERANENAEAMLRILLRVQDYWAGGDCPAPLWRDLTDLTATVLTGTTPSFTAADAANQYTITELAEAFFNVLDGWSLPMAKIRAANAAETDPAICHTGDYCDSNEAMLEAWHNTQGLPLFDVQDDNHRALWNAAWAEAKRDYLTAEQGE